MWAPGEDAQADGVHVFLDGRVYDVLRRLAAAGVDDLEVGVAQAHGHHPHSAVVSVQARLGQHYAVSFRHLYFIPLDMNRFKCHPRGAPRTPSASTPQISPMVA